VSDALNLSSDKKQEFFSDGMTEEITAALAHFLNKCGIDPVNYPL
jgi:TolB-like protein